MAILLKEKSCLLWLSYDIVKAQFGEIKENTKEGKGSTFTIQQTAQ